MDRPPDYWGLRERAEEAKSLLGSPIFGMAIGELRRALMDQLISLPSSDPGIMVAHTKLKVLDDIAAQLQSYVNEAQFRKLG